MRGLCGAASSSAPSGRRSAGRRARRRAAGLARTYAVIVDVPLGEQLVRELQADTGIACEQHHGARDLGPDAPVADRQGTARPLRGGLAGIPAIVGAGQRLAGEQSGAGASAGSPSSSIATGTAGEPGTLLVSSFRLSTYGGLTSAFQARRRAWLGNRTFGQALLLVLLVVVGGLFLVIEVVALVVGLALARSITGSVHELFAGTERVRQGDFTHKIADHSRAISSASWPESFNSMTASIEDLLRQAAEKKRLEEELRIAHEIQMSLLPQGPLVMPGLSATALCIPAREVGGDYYDFLPLDDHRVGILIADVSGKGTSAAFYMAQLKGLMLSLSAIHSSPRALLIAANRIIAQHLDARTFITDDVRRRRSPRAAR